jgi:hypothetical protein
MNTSWSKPGVRSQEFLTDTMFSQECLHSADTIRNWLPANVHTFTPNMNEMHLQHIRTKRPDAAYSWLVSRSTSDRNLGQDNHYWRHWPPSYWVNLQKFWNISLKTGPLPFTAFPEDSSILGRYVSLVDRWFPTFRNIVMPSYSRCFDLTLADDGTATFETSVTTHPRTSRRSHSRGRNAQLHRPEREFLHR